MLLQLARRRETWLDARFELDDGFDDRAAQRVGTRNSRGFHHRRMLEQRALDLAGSDSAAGRNNEIVGAAGIPEIAVAVASGQIAGEVEVAAKRRGLFDWILPVLDHQRRGALGAYPDRDLADLTITRLDVSGAEHANVVARERTPHRACLDFHARNVG